MSYFEAQDGYRLIFIEVNGTGPWECYFGCGELVTEYGGNGGRNLLVHHRDGDHSNNAPDNLVGSHWDCHSVYHATEKWAPGAPLDLAVRGVPKAPEHRAKIAAANRGRTVSAETRAKISAAKKGKSNPKLSAALKGKKHSAEARARMSAAHRGELNGFYGKKHSAETRAKISAARKTLDEKR